MMDFIVLRANQPPCSGNSSHIRLTTQQEKIAHRIIEGTRIQADMLCVKAVINIELEVAAIAAVHM